MLVDAGVGETLALGLAPGGEHVWPDRACLYSPGVRLRAGVGCEVHRGGLEKGPFVVLLQPLGGEVPDGTLLSTTFVKTEALLATFVYSNVLSAMFCAAERAACPWGRARVA